MTIISTYFKEEGDFKARAEVVRVEQGVYKINYYDVNGEFFQEEYFPGKSIYYVEDAAENWALGIKVLNG